MCFKINPYAKPPRAKYAYKVVELTPFGNLQSVLYPQRTHPWSYPGEVVHRSKGPTSSSRTYAGDRTRNARHGIYVFHRLQDAKYSLCWCRDRIILKVAVDQKDWLYSNKHSPFLTEHISTYDKVTVCKEQPYLDWY